MAAPGEDPTKAATPVTIAEAERYGELCKVRQMQKPLEQLSQDAKKNGVSVEQELSNRGMKDTYDFIESCEKFPLTCDLMDFSELGSGFPLYFQFLQFLGFMLLIFLIIQSPLMAKNVSYKAMNTWRSDLTTEQVKACSTCTGDNKGVTGARGVVDVKADYGEQCGAHDITGCSMYTETDLAGQEKGLWCCQSWCYVSDKCPIAQSSGGTKGLYFSYNACKDDPKSMKECAWQKNITYDVQGQSEVPTSMIDPGFPLLGGVTPGNAGKPPEHGIEGGFHGIINFIALCVFCAALVFQKARIRYTDTAVDAETTQPNDFAILCQGLPGTATDEKTIADFWKKNAVKDKEVDIVKVIIGWNLEEFNKLTDELKKLNQVRVKLMTQHGMAADNPQVKSIVEQMTEIRKQIISTGPQVAARMTSTGINIVIFRTQGDHRACLKRWTGFWPRNFNCESSCHGLCKGEPLPRWLDGAGREVATVSVKRADNPMDVNWQDLGRTREERMKRFLQNTFFMAVLIGIAFGLIALLETWEDELKKEKANEETGQTEMEPSKALVIVPALLVSLLNMILNMSARRLSAREYHNSKTDEQASTILKMATSLIMNTAGVTLILKSRDGTKGWYVQNGLVDAVYYMLLINAIFPPLLARCDMMGLFSKSMRSARKMGEKMEAAPRKQGEMYKKYWEPSEFDTPRRYANALQTFISCSLYQPIMPQVMIWGLIGIVLQYWIDKYMLLRVNKRPEAIEGSNCAYSAEAIARVFVTFGLPIAILIFLSPSAKDQSAVTPFFALGLMIAAATAILPDAIQRMLLCTFCCLSREKFDEESGAAALDYYAAQLFWPATMKYNKTHPLYKTLPEAINPENLSPGAGMISGEEMRKGCQGFTDKASATQRFESAKLVKPIVIGRGQIHDFKRGAQPIVATSSVLVAPGAMTGVAPAPTMTTVSPVVTADGVGTSPSTGYTPGQSVGGFVPGQAVATVQASVPVAQVQGSVMVDDSGGGGDPVWEFETKHGYEAFGDDCQKYMETIYQDYKSGKKGPKRKVKSKGKEVNVDFEAMESSVGHSDHKRKVRRRT